MQIKYFPDTDTLYLSFSEKEIIETKDLSEDILIDVDKNGNLVGMTVEHAKQRADIDNFSYQKIVNQVAA